jgi:hypothetical protein
MFPIQFLEWGIIILFIYLNVLVVFLFYFIFVIVYHTFNSEK